jgi:putative endonuclease
MRHNAGETQSIRYGIPWRLLGVVVCKTRSEAVQLEKQIKKRGIERWLNENRDRII